MSERKINKSDILGHANANKIFVWWNRETQFEQTVEVEASLIPDNWGRKEHLENVLLLLKLEILKLDLFKVLIFLFLLNIYTSSKFSMKIRAVMFIG